MNRIETMVYDLIDDLYFDSPPVRFLDLMEKVRVECGPLVNEDFVRAVIDHEESSYLLINGELVHEDDFVEDEPEEEEVEEEKKLILTLIIP